jgi:hypothetical protein
LKLFLLSGGTPAKSVGFEDSVQNKFQGEAMSKEKQVSNVFYSFLPTEVEGFDSLAELRRVGQRGR